MALETKMEKERLFVAIDIPQSIGGEVIKVQQELQRKNLFEGRYTIPQSMHITIKFLGEVDVAVVPTIREALQSITLSSFRAKLGSLDVFHSGRNIKIIFVRLIAPEFLQLAAQLDDILDPWFEPEDRAFVGHLTLARTKEVPDNHTLLTALNKIVVKPLEFVITEFVLKKSVRASQGAQHAIVERYQLG